MKGSGADVELYYTSDLKIVPCRGEASCWLKTPGECILDDDMSWLRPKIEEADVWVFASPVYFDGLTGPMKTLMDRMLPRGLPSIELREGHTRHPYRGKAKHRMMVLVSTCGLYEIDNFSPMLKHVGAFCKNADVEFAGALLRPHGLFLKPMLEKGAPVNDIIDAARDAGRQMAGDGKMSAVTLNAISRPLLPLDAYVRAFNRRADEAMAIFPRQERGQGGR